MFSPIVAIMLVTISWTVSPLAVLAAEMASTPSVVRATSAISRAAAWKVSFLPTKSVSAFSSISAPVLPSALTLPATRPSAAARPDFFSAFDRPFLRSSSMAASMSPPVSCRAFLQSIMPTPDFSRRSLTSAAVISAMVSSFKSYRGRAEPSRTPPLNKGSSQPIRRFERVSAGLFFARLLFGRRGLFRRDGGGIGLGGGFRGRFGRGFGSGRRLGLGLLRLGFGRGFAARQGRLHRSLRGAQVDARGRLAGGQAVEDRVGHQVAIELNGARGVIVARDREGDAVGIAVGVEDRDHRDVELARFLDGDRFLVGVDHEHQVGDAAHVLDAAQGQFQLLALAGQGQQLLLGAAGVLAVEQAFQFAQTRDGARDGAPVGERAAQPAV